MIIHLGRSSKSWCKLLCMNREIRRNKTLLTKCKEIRNKKKYVLGIETSCDDTGAAVVSDAGEVLGEAHHNQNSVHLRNGGIIPNLAQSLHEKNIEQIVNTALHEAGMSVKDLDAIATTVKPGMALSLKVGTNYGKSLSVRSGKPFIPIHHMEAHALTIRMVEKVQFPFLVLLVSGGHSLIVVADSLDHWSIIGQSVDLAPGQALDKGARRLKLRNIPQYSQMSGGQAIEHLAREGDPRAFDFPSPMWKYRDCSFSFSGLRYTLDRTIVKLEKDYGIEGGTVLPCAEDLCASYQYAITKHLVRQTHKAMIYIATRKLLPVENQNLVVSGGVACNQYIRGALQKLCTHTGYQLFCPPPKLCTDNGIMIAWNGMERWMAQCGVLYDKEEIEAVTYQPTCDIGEDLTKDVRDLGISIIKHVKFR